MYVADMMDDVSPSIWGFLGYLNMQLKYSDETGDSADKALTVTIDSQNDVDASVFGNVWVNVDRTLKRDLEITYEAKEQAF